MTRIQEFAEIELSFRERAHTMVWCSFATIDTHNRPSSRIMHPIWEGKTGWVATNRNSLKGRHLVLNPFISLAYITDPLKPVYAECTAFWEDELSPKEHIWELFRLTAPPLGYDSAVIWRDVTNPEFGLLKLMPYRSTLGNLAEPGESKFWRGSPVLPVASSNRP